jgi:hypothetical protein
MLLALSKAIRGTQSSNITKYVEYLDKYLKERDIHRKWSKEVNEVMITANILWINLSSLRNNNNCSKQIAQKQSLLKIQIEVPESIEEAKKALGVEQKNCRTLINERRTKKTSIGAEQEAAYVAMNPEIDTKRAAQIFKWAKEANDMMLELPSKMNCPGGISSILVPLPKEGTELEYLAITDRPTIGRLILHRNIRHFWQAETTPLATPEVIKTIGFGADTERTEAILERNDDPTDITDDVWSRYLLTSMKRHLKELDIKINNRENDGEIQEMEGKNKHITFRTAPGKFSRTVTTTGGERRQI